MRFFWSLFFFPLFTFRFFDSFPILLLSDQSALFGESGLEPFSEQLPPSFFAHGADWVPFFLLLSGPMVFSRGEVSFEIWLEVFLDAKSAFLGLGPCGLFSFLEPGLQSSPCSVRS